MEAQAATLNTERLVDSVFRAPEVVGVLSDRQLVALGKAGLTDPHHQAHFWAETLTRLWLYADRCPRELCELAGLFWSGKRANTQWKRRFESKLLPLRNNDDGQELSDSGDLDANESRVWGLLVARVRAFLEADGLIALIPSGAETIDGVAVPFRFVADDAGQFLDGKNKPLVVKEWSHVLQQLGDYGPLASNQSVRIEASFPTATSLTGASLGLSLAVAWARRQARAFPLFSPLALLATGELRGNEVFAVRGTGGQTEHDMQGGAKGQLAYRLGVKLYLAVDMSTEFSAGNGIKVCSFTSGAKWEQVHSQCAQSVKDLNFIDAPRHLQRVEQEESRPVGTEDLPASELWSRWRRLGRVRNSLPKSDQRSTRAATGQRRIEVDLGFYDVGSTAAASDQVVADYRSRRFVGRSDQTTCLNQFLTQSQGGVIAILGPPGYGKSALMAQLVDRLPTNRASLVHFFRHGRERTRPVTAFVRRLWHFLLSEIGAGEGIPGQMSLDELVARVDIAWQDWASLPTRRPMVIVIDGLDEARDAFEPPWPSGLPSKVHVIVACRTGTNFDPPPKWRPWLQGATSIPLGGLNVEELLDWLGDLSESERAKLPDLRKLAAVMEQRTLGCALFAQFLLDDLRRGITTGQSWEAILARTPTGFADYLYQQYLDFDGPGTNRARELIALLLAAYGPLHLGEIQRMLTDLEPGYAFTDLPWQAYRWVTREPGKEGWGERFSLTNDVLREALSKVVVQTNARERLLAYCQMEKHRSPYAIQHVADHLVNRLMIPTVALGTITVTESFMSTLPKPALQEGERENSVIPSSLSADRPQESGKILDIASESILEARTPLPDPIPQFDDPSKRPVASWSELEALNQDPVFVEASHVEVPNEPAPVLNAVRRALEQAVNSPKPDYSKVTELALTHAKLLQQLTQQDKCSVECGRSALETAEHSLNLPVQWDPAAQVMWRLVAAWEHHRTRQTKERNRHFKALANTYNVRLPAAWKFLAGAILVEILPPYHPFLASLARRFLNAESIGEMVGRLVHKGETGIKAARQWLQDCSDHEALALRRHIVYSLADAKRWREAEQEAYTATTASEQAGLLLRLAEIAKDDLIQTDRLRKWGLYLSQRIEMARLANSDEPREQEKLSNRDLLRVTSALACIDSIRTGHYLLRRNPDAQQLAKQAESTVSGERLKQGSSLIDVQLILASGYATAAAGNKNKKEQHRLRSLARLHRRKAFREWIGLREMRNAQTLEIFQGWLGIASLTFGLVRQGVLTARIGRGWENRLRKILISTDDTGDLRISSLLNCRKVSLTSEVNQTGTPVPALRYLEPIEWDIAMLSAVETALEAQGLAHGDVMQVISRSRNPEGRARGMARWVKRIVEMDQTSVVDSVLAKADLRPEDLAAAYSLLARRLLNKDDTNAAVRYSIQSIQAGTKALHAEHSAQQVELIAALSRAAGLQGRILFDEASRLVSKYPNSRPVEKTFLCLSLGSTAVYHRRRNLKAVSDRIQWTDEANFWFEEITKLQQRPGTAYQRRARKVTILCEYARSLFKLDWSLSLDRNDWSEALNAAEIAARNEPSLQRRCELMCEVAEAFAVCGDVDRANALFSDIQTELPVSLTDNAFPDGFLWRKRGIKQRMLRAYCLAELVLGLGKASTRADESIAGYHRSGREGAAQPEWGLGRTLNSNQRARIKEITIACENGDAGDALHAASQISGGDSTITELRASIYRDIASRLDWSEWALTYADDKDLQTHEPAIRGWALASAAQNQWDQAMRFVRRISDPTVCAKTFCDLAELSARRGAVYDVRKRAGNLMSNQDKDWLLHRVGGALIERFRDSCNSNEQTGLKQVIMELVSPCAESFAATYQILARLVELEPWKWRAVAECLRDRGLINA